MSRDVIDVVRLDVASVFPDGAEVEVRTPAGEVVGADTPAVGVATFAALVAGGLYVAHGKVNGQDVALNFTAKETKPERDYGRGFLPKHPPRPEPSRQQRRAIEERERAARARRIASGG
jgi:hypothetical protein